MTKLCYLVVFGLAGCPPPPRYVVTQVMTTDRPLEDAMVAVDCGQPTGAALRTNDLGKARIRVAGNVDPSKCMLTAAKPGFKTVQASGAQICDTPSACPPITLQVDPLGPQGAGVPESPPAEVAK